MSNSKKIEMVVFDWAGTTVDYGSSAPTEVFKRVFENAKIHLTKDEINKPMGMEKKAHIRQLLSTENATQQWEKEYNRKWNEEDVENLYQVFEKELFNVVEEYSVPIDGVVETVNKLKENGIKIGSTTGYTSQMMTKVLPKASALGYEADCVVTPDVTKASRPTPFMLFECMRQLNVYPPKSVVKVGDTVVDIHEGKNAGAWSIGILVGSNLLGLSKEEYENLSKEELDAKKAIAIEKYKEAGADLVIDSIKDLPLAIEEINFMLNKEDK